MKNKGSLADTTLLCAAHFTAKANNASSEAEKLSLQRCAEASIRLSAKVKKLQQEHTGMPLFQALNELPERQILVRERRLRSELIDGSEVNE